LLTGIGPLNVPDTPLLEEMMANRNVARAVRLALIAAGATSAGFHAPAVIAQDAELEQIVVTGSRIARSELESDAPLALVSSADIARTGLVSVGDVLQALSSTDGTGLRPITTQTNGSDGASQISLRNLGAERTLILVDGRRWVTDGSGIVDLNTIPSSMIERIEVLKDGASAIYGSDAIAGVINIITKKEFEGVQLDAYYGTTSAGDGAQDNYGVTIGANGERGNGVVNINYSSQEAIFAKDRKISKTPYYGCTDPNVYDPFGLCGSASTPWGSFAVPGLSGRRTLAQDGSTGESADDFVPFTSLARFNFAPQNYMQQPVERTNIFASGNYEITDHVEAYAKAVYTKIESSQQLASVPLTANMNGANGPQWQIPISSASYFNPFGQTISAWNSRSVVLGPRNPTYDYDVYGVNLGVKGDFDAFERTFNWDMGLQYNDGQYDSVGKNYVNLFNLKNALGPSFRDTEGVLRCGTPGAVISGCVPYNVFGGPDLGLANGVITAEEQAQMKNYVGYTQVSTSGNTSTNWYADISTELFQLPAGALGVAIGLEDRKNEYFDQPDTLVASGGSSDNFSEPTKGQQTVFEYYIEANIPVLKDVVGAQELTVNVANRWSEYDAKGRVGLENVESEPGNPSTTKISLIWRPIDQLMIRGSWGETFRAPSVVDLYAGQGESFPQVQDPCNTGGWATLTAEGQQQCIDDGVPVGGWVQPTGQLRALIGGNPDLTPEQGDNLTYGFVWEPTFLDNFSMTVDYWSIQLEDAIQYFGASTTLSRCYRALETDYCDLVDRTVLGEVAGINTTYFNAAEREASGVDLGLRYSFDTEGWGSFGFQWDTTYVLEDKFKLSDATEWTEATGIYDGVVHWELRSNLTTTWSLDNLSAAWTMRYTSELEDDCWVGSPDYGYGYTKFNDGETPMLCSDPNKKMSNDLADYWGYERGTVGVNILDSMVYHDLQVSYSAPWNGVITVGGRNIFGSEPPLVNNSFAHSFDGAYDLPGGPYWYASYKQNF
jgi:iron complex outermembrane receptor protein